MMTQRNLPGHDWSMLDVPLVETDAAPDLDYGEFMRSTTPQERVEAIKKYFANSFDGDAVHTIGEILTVMNWMVEAAGPRGYEVVPLDWIRKLRQQKAGTK